MDGRFGMKPIRMLSPLWTLGRHQQVYTILYNIPNLGQFGLNPGLYIETIPLLSYFEQLEEQ